MMDALIKSKKSRILLSLAYASGVTYAAVRFGVGNRATGPLVLIALGVPLIFKLVPRNYFYGMRSRRTLWTDEVTWYRQNVITGIVMVAVGLVWLVVLAVR